MEQLQEYVDELGTEVVAGVLIAREFPRSVAYKLQMQRNNNLKAVECNIKDFSMDESYTFEQLREKFKFQKASA